MQSSQRLSLREMLRSHSRPRLALRFVFWSLETSAPFLSSFSLPNFAPCFTIAAGASDEASRLDLEAEAQLDVELARERLLTRVFSDATDTGMTSPCVFNADRENTGVGSTS